MILADQSPGKPTRVWVVLHLAHLCDLAIKLDAVKSKLLQAKEDPEFVDAIVDASFDRLAQDLASPEAENHRSFHDSVVEENKVALSCLAFGVLDRFRHESRSVAGQTTRNVFHRCMAVFVSSACKLMGVAMSSRSLNGIRDIRAFLHDLASGEVLVLHKDQANGTSMSPRTARGDGASKAAAAYPTPTKVGPSSFATSHTSTAQRSHTSTSQPAAVTPTTTATQTTRTTTAGQPTATNTTVTPPPSSNPQTAVHADTSASALPAAPSPPVQAQESIAHARSALSWEERSRLLIQDLDLQDEDHLIVNGRTYFFITTLAKHFGPSLKKPADAANSHARRYGSFKDNKKRLHYRSGVRQQAGSWIMTLKAFQGYVLSHIRDPAPIPY